jgi:hypothetical protein
MLACIKLHDPIIALIGSLNTENYSNYSAKISNPIMDGRDVKVQGWNPRPESLDPPTYSHREISGNLSFASEVTKADVLRIRNHTQYKNTGFEAGLPYWSLLQLSRYTHVSGTYLVDLATSVAGHFRFHASPSSTILHLHYFFLLHQPRARLQ